MKKSKTTSEVRRASGPVGNITGVPALLMGHETTADVRAARILGMRHNHIIRAIKESSGRIYRQAISHAHIDPKENLSKQDHDAIHISVIYSDNALRNMLMVEHARAAFTPNGRPEKIPVLEYALLKAWDPQLALFQRGEYSPSRNSELQDGAGQPVADRQAALPFFSSQVQPFFLTLREDTPWLSEEVFTPFWLTPTADRLLSELASWDQLGEEQQAALAGAVYAVTSSLCSPRMLQCFLDVEPRLGLYMEGVCGLTDDDEPWDGSVWTRQSMSEVQSQLVLGMSWMNALQNSIVEKCELGTIEMMRKVIDKCEKVVMSAASLAVGEAREHLAESKALLEKMIADLSVTGRSFEFIAVVARINAWVDVLGDERMGEVGAAQTELLGLVRQEATEIAQTLAGLITRFEAVSEKHKAILAGDLTWQEQAKRMQELSEELDALEAACGEFNSRFEGREKPVLDTSTAAAEEELSEEDSELEKARRASAELAEKLAKAEERADDFQTLSSCLDAENDSLRQENSDLRRRVATLQLALGSNSRDAASEGMGAGLLEAIEEMIDSSDALSLCRLVAQMYPDRIRFLESAFESAERNVSSLPVQALYQRLKALALPGLDRVRESGRLIDLRDVVPGDITAQESETVKGNAKLRNMRTFRDGDKQRVVYPHLSIDYSHRLYFDYDADESRIIVAYVGKHLPSAKNSTV